MDLGWQGHLVHVSQVFILCNRGEDIEGGCKRVLNANGEYQVQHRLGGLMKFIGVSVRSNFLKRFLGIAREQVQHFFCTYLFNFG